MEEQFKLISQQIIEIRRELDILKQRRIDTVDILPGAINSRQLGDVIESIDATSASASVGNGSQLVLTHTLTQNQNAKMLANVFVGKYVGTATAANKLPGGSGIDESQWQFGTPQLDITTGDENIVLTDYVRNISAGTVTVIWVIKDRYIANFPGGTNE